MEIFGDWLTRGGAVITTALAVHCLTGLPLPPPVLAFRRVGLVRDPASTLRVIHLLILAAPGRLIGMVLLGRRFQL